MNKLKTLPPMTRSVLFYYRGYDFVVGDYDYLPPAFGIDAEIDYYKIFIMTPYGWEQLHEAVLDFIDTLTGGDFIKTATEAVDTYERELAEERHE